MPEVSIRLIIGPRKKPFYFLTGELPVLAKHYKGTITFVWDGVKQTRNSEIWIDQTFLNVSVKLGTNESTSNSVTAGIEKVNNEQQLIYTYLNTPKAELQDRSAIHYGTAMLCVDDSRKRRKTANCRGTSSSVSAWKTFVTASWAKWSKWIPRRCGKICWQAAWTQHLVMLQVL